MTDGLDEDMGAVTPPDVELYVEADDAFDTDLIFSGSFEARNALCDGTETLSVSVYDTETGSNFIGNAQTYLGSALTYTFANGTILRVDGDRWTYDRLASDVEDGEEHKYKFTFSFSGAKFLTKVVDVIPLPNVSFNSFEFNSLDDSDAQIHGVLDINIHNFAGLTIAVDVSTDSRSLKGGEQELRNYETPFVFTYSNGAKCTVNLKEKTIVYDRPDSEVDDGITNAYVFLVSIGTKTSTATIDSVIGLPPTIDLINVNPASDTDAVITGSLLVGNSVSTTMYVDVTKNGVLYEGGGQLYVKGAKWTYEDGSTFEVNLSKGSWTYTRVLTEVGDLNADKYVFSIRVSNKHGEDVSVVGLSTAIPKATFTGFFADSFLDSDAQINGVLNFKLPDLSTNPSIVVNIVVNGATYKGTAVAITPSGIASFSYANDSSLVVDFSANTFVYTRAIADVVDASADIYSFECIVTVNGQATAQTIVVKSFASVRNYDYQPAYPVNFYAGSTETEATAWAKYIEEIKRIYRLFNENMNYYEHLVQRLSDKIDVFAEKFKGALDVMKKSMASDMVGAITIWFPKIEDIPEGWAICDGKNGTPNLVDRFLQGTDGDERDYIPAGLPNITGYHGAWNYNVAGGAFYGRGDLSENIKSGSHSTQGLGFDASRCNPIYGASDTVQPNSFTVVFIMKVYDVPIDLGIDDI